MRQVIFAALIAAALTVFAGGNSTAWAACGCKDKCGCSQKADCGCKDKCGCEKPKCNKCESKCGCEKPKCNKCESKCGCEKPKCGCEKKCGCKDKCECCPKKVENYPDANRGAEGEWARDGLSRQKA